MGYTNKKMDFDSKIIIEKNLLNKKPSLKNGFLNIIMKYKNYETSTFVSAAIFLYVPFTNFSRIASKAVNVSSTSLMV